MDHCEIKHMAKQHQLFLVLDGATSLLWEQPRKRGTEPVTQDLFREWMHLHSCELDDSLRYSWCEVYANWGLLPLPNRAETAVRLFQEAI